MRFMKKSNLLRYLTRLLLFLTLFIPTAPQPVTAADAVWSALPMPQAGTVTDMAVAPNGSIYLLSFDNGHSLWRTTNDGGTWLGILQTGQFGLSSIERITVAGDGTLFAAGTSGAGSFCLRSTDSGQNFTSLTLPAAMDSSAGFTAVDSQRFFYTSFDGTFSRVWRTANGTTFTSTAVSGGALSTLELSPNFAADNTLIAVGGDGTVYMSTDGGATFTGLQQSPLVGDIHMAFAPDFTSSRYIYAASRTAGAGIWRLKAGEPAWTRVDTGLPAGTIISGLSVSSGSTIYASTANQVSPSSGGLVRGDEGTTWNWARDGLPPGAVLWGLHQRGNRLYSLDTANNRTVTYTDTLASPIVLVSPPAGAPGLGTFSAGTVGGIDLAWLNPGGAGAFQWQVSDIADMSVTRFEGTTAAETYRLRNLEPGVIYYWRVRATLPLTGPWSAIRSFTTALGTPALLVPAPGATSSTLLPPFQWQPSTGATSYELALSTLAGFQTVTALVPGIPGNVWRPDTALVPATAYFWKVRAIGQNTFSPWSAVSSFVTAAPPPTTTRPPASTTAQPPPTTTTPLPTTTSAPPVTTTAAIPSATTPQPTTTAPAAPASFGRLGGDEAPAWLIFVLIGMGGLSVVVGVLVIRSIKTKKRDQ
jgi:photosystem II stability/assembly factor-like uncharacterized protein